MTKVCLLSNKIQEGINENMLTSMNISAKGNTVSVKMGQCWLASISSTTAVPQRIFGGNGVDGTYFGKVQPN